MTITVGQGGWRWAVNGASFCSPFTFTVDFSTLDTFTTLQGAMQTLSAYEVERERNMAANKRVLASLGLERTRDQTTVRDTKRQRSSQRSTMPLRASSRLSSLGDRGATITSGVDPSPPSWHLAVFDQCERAWPVCASYSFDARRHHQHIQRSASGRAIATTGVAGYGAALCAQCQPSKATSAWQVVVVRFGVGGFGVGVVKNSMRPPFKSIGRSEAALAVYLANGDVSCGGVQRPFGPPLEVGDQIGVLLRPPPTQSAKISRKRHGREAKSLELAFFVNGREVGVAAETRDCQDSFQLAVQPYMGELSPFRTRLHCKSLRMPDDSNAPLLRLRVQSLLLQVGSRCSLHLARDLRPAQHD